MGWFESSTKLGQREIPKAKVISMLNQKGGVGKTTMVFNLAHALCHEGHRVLCLDMDPQGNLSLLFRGEEGRERSPYHLHHLLINSLRELKLLHQPVMVSDVLATQDGVDLLPSGSELSGLELTVAALATPRQLILKRFLEKSGLLDRYDYILVDGPPTLGLLVINIMCASDGLIIPFQADQFSRHGLEQLHQILEDVADMEICEGPRILGYIPNLVDGRRKQEEKDFSDIDQMIKRNQGVRRGEGKWGRPQIYAPFSNRVQLVKANGQRKSVFAFKSREFEELQRQFLILAHDIQERMR